MISTSLARDVPHPRRTSEPAMWALALAIGAVWFFVLAASSPAGRATPAWLAPVAGLATQCLFAACEAVTAGALWRAIGKRAAWRSLLPRLLVASAPEALAVSLVANRALWPHSLVIGLAGPRGLSPATSGLAFAFASAGALTLARLVLSALLQSRAARANVFTALAIVAGMWLVTRLVMWWTFDLLEGRSFR